MVWPIARRKWPLHGAKLKCRCIAAAQGFALGGGFQLFMGADMRYAAPGTKFSIMESRWGLVPDMGTTHVMTRASRAKILSKNWP